MKIHELAFLVAALALCLAPAPALARTAGDVLEEIGKIPDVLAKAPGELCTVVEAKEKALFLMFRFEAGEKDREAEIAGNRPYLDMKALLLRELWTTALLITTDGHRNPVLGLQSILHYPAQKHALLKNLERQDFFLWCLTQEKTQGMLNPEDARGYLALSAYHPTTGPDHQANPGVIAFLQGVAGKP